ncbi:diguanylate cyclase [Zavarzinia compransoris]|nr:diguanylate cyclase [Zavarzinia compransoris]TDP44036.1 PAS domain S-box-containing protein/diguanylate cyclase (GGDEF)-like protein [Zavarzinia compransoris]
MALLPFRTRAPLYWRSLVFVALACLSLVGLEGFRQWTARENRIEAIYRETANLAGSLSQQATNSLQITDAVLRDIADRYGDGSALDDDARQRLRAAMVGRTASFPLLQGLFIMDEHGDPVVTSVPDPQPRFNYSDRAYFDYHRGHAEISLHIGEAVLSKTSGNWIITVTRRLNKPDGSFNGVVLASISLDFFKRFYDGFDVGERGVITLVRGDGRILMRKPFEEATLGKSMLNGPVFRDLLPRGPTGNAETVSSIDGIRRFLSFRRVEDFPLVIIVALSTDEALASWRAATWQGMGTAIALSLFLAYLGLAMARQARQRDRAEQAVTASEASYRLLAENASDLVLKLDADGQPTYASPSCADILGYEPGPFVTLPYGGLVHPDDLPRLLAIMKAVAKNGHGSATTRVRHRKGHYIWLETSLRYIPAERGFIAAARDVSERRAVEDRLAATSRALDERRHRIDLIGRMAQRLPCCRDIREFSVTVECFVPQILPGVAGAFYLFTAGKGHLDRLAAWGDTAALMPAGFEAEDCWALRRGQGHIVGTDGAELVCSHHGSQPRPYACLPLVAQEKTAGLLYLQTAVDPADRDMNMLVETISLALVNLQLREDLREQSIRDALTGLFNRRYLEEAIELEIARAGRDNTPLSVLMIDADHFKRLNDSFGHEAGDHVLAEIGRLLAAQFRAGDIACRYGGEEFTVILPGAGQADARRRAEQLRAAVAGHAFVHQDRDIGQVTLSIGVATLPEDGDTADALLTSGDKALYAAKQAGRNRVVARVAAAA